LMKNIFEKAGFDFLVEAQSNQLFPILPNWLMDKISQKYSTSVWSKPDNDHTCVRFCTSWATKEADIISFEKDFNEIVKEGAHTLDGVQLSSQK